MQAQNINETLLASFHHHKDRVVGSMARALPNWMTPNVITWFRIVLVAPIYVLYQADHVLAAFILFVVALFSDMLDGVQARRLHMETTLGKLLDPAADKIFVITLFLMTAPDRVSSIIITVLIGLEIGLVLLAAVIGPLAQRFMKRKPKVGANNAGKIKMTLESIGILILFLWPNATALYPYVESIFWLAAAFALLSIVLHLFLRESQTRESH